MESLVIDPRPLTNIREAGCPLLKAPRKDQGVLPGFGAKPFEKATAALRRARRLAEEGKPPCWADGIDKDRAIGSLEGKCHLLVNSDGARQSIKTLLHLPWIEVDVLTYWRAMGLLV